MSSKFLHLTKRFEFLRVSKNGTTVPKPSFVLQFFSHVEVPAEIPEKLTTPPVRFGFTASRKVGNAVKRNRAKRRLRALVQKNLPLMQTAFSKPLDIVFVARSRTGELPFARLERDFQETFALMRKR